MKKKILLWSGGIALALVLALGIWTLIEALTVQALVTDTYQIYEKDGKCYLTTDKYDGNADVSHVPTLKITYASVDEMQDALLSGTLDSAARFSLTNHSDLDSREGIKTIEICDIRNIYDIAMPSQADLLYVTFDFREFAFTFSDYPIGGVMETTGKIEGYVETFYHTPYNDPEGFAKSKRVELASVQDISDRNAKEIIVNYISGEEHRYLFYTVFGWHGTVYVIEEYAYGKLQMIELFGEDGGADFRCELYNINERPSEAYLASFGLNFRLDLWKPFAY